MRFEMVEGSLLRPGTPPFGLELFEGDSGGLLLGLLLGGAFGLGEGPLAALSVGDPDLYAEELLVIGAALGGEDVLRLAGAGSLEVLLESGLVIADGSGEGTSGGESTVKFRKRGLYDVAFDEGSRGVESTVEIKGGDDGLEGVGEERGFLSSAALLFAATEAEHGSESDAIGDMAEMAAADERGTKTRELAFASVREETVEALGDGETEDSVADKFKLLVVAGGRRRSVRIGLVGEGAMGEGESEEVGPAEAMVEEGRGGLARRSSCGLSARWHS
jgi:hypothetical protein